ncbi:Sugar phosphate isomerase/epimerase [Georgenia satyanarayanai]|uniref:Sugar phosphate isomerase/epimerase n=1 Tax=Georgenia satyanarayanai TaxID=860221 RepID=A0A2Y9ASK9_9MICO|nr:TIM barrel protein [Georgenia satyanarayanai]PYF96283.1 sugar phosphate isomerase/epimerase [Georgenia satyanarayanai]SSA47065.1 Sugar phosphate isomerase/epimerase [Georgenia satyanarayanai]
MVRRSTGRRWATRGASALLTSALVLPLAMSGAQAQTEPPEAEPAPVEDPALDWNNYEKVLLTKNTGEPIDLAVLPDSRVLHTARNGVVRLTDPGTGATTQIAQLDVYANSEDGLQGVSLDPNFEENGWVYLVYAPRVMSGTSPTGVEYPETTPAGNAPNSLPEGADPETYWDQWLGYNVLSRFQFDAEAGTLDLESEQEIIKVDAQRGQCCHVGADMAWDAEGNLFLSTGDNTPAGTPGANGYTPINNAPGMNPGFDDRRGAGNTNDLRGSILRINPLDEIDAGAETGPGSTYTIPEGNLFDSEEYDPDLVREEIYVMGVRNPFRIDYDIESEALVWGDYGPDAGEAQADRGPMGYVEWQLTTEPMNSGWPYCHGPNDGGAYNEWNFETNSPGDITFDCDAGPVNNSTFNTGLEQVPPVTEPQVYYGDSAGDQPELLDPLAELGGGGQAPMGGPVYRYDESLESENKFPEYWDGKPFMAEFSQDYVVAFTMDELSSEGEVTEVTDFLPNLHLETVNQPIWDNVMDFEFGPDGAMYVLEYGDGFFRQNPDAGLYVVNYVGEGNKTPQASFTATPASSSGAPLEVVFDASASRDPEGEELTYEWDLDGDGEYDDATGVNPTYTYEALGVYDAALRAVDPEGKAALAIRQITVGNTAPEITLSVDNGAIFNWGDDVPVSVSVTDAEDGEEFNCNGVRWTFGLGHNEHAHPEVSGRGCEFVIETSEDATEHGAGEKLYGTLVVTYADQAQEDVPSITGEATLILKPEVQQAEWYDAADGATVVDDAEADAGSYVELGEGSITFRPMAMTHAPTGDVIDTVTARGAGEGTVSLTWAGEDTPFAEVEFTGGEPSERNLTAQSTVGQWLADPVGAEFVSGLIPEEFHDAVRDVPLEGLVELSEGQISAHAIAELVEAYRNAPAAPGDGGWQEVEARFTSVPEGSGEVVVTSTGVDLDYLAFTASGEEPPVENIRIPAEKVSIGMFSLIPWVREAGLPTVLERLAEIGFQNVEPFGSNFNGYTAEEFRAMVDEIGLKVPSSHYNVAEDTFDATLDYVETLGQQYVGSGGFAAPGINETETASGYENTLATAATMNRLGERSVEAGLGKFFGHNHDREFTTVYEHEGEELSAWEILVRETNPEFVTFQLDVAWAAHAGVDVPALIEEYGDRIELLHVKDAVNVAGEGRPTFTNLGEGEVPLQEILRAAEEHADIALYVLEYDQAPLGELFAETGFSYLTGEELVPVRVDTEDVSIGMFSLIPWVNEAGLPSVLARLAEIGFENVEPFGGNLGGYTAEQFRAMTDLIGLNVPSSHYNVDVATFPATLEYVETLGQEYVGSGGFAEPGFDSIGRVMDTARTMNALGRASVEAGVGKFFGHNHAGEFTRTFDYNGEQTPVWEILVEETDSEYVTFQLDVAWAAHAGVDVPALIEEHGDRIELLHVKDATNLGGDRPTFTNLGEGDVPLQDILRAARDHANVELYVLEYDVAPLGENFAETGFEYLTGQPAGEEGSRPVETTTAPVTFTDEYGTAGDTFTVPRVTGVEYVVNGEIVEAGTHPGVGTVTVTAQAAEGFVLADGSATEWSHTFSTAGAPAPDRRTAEFHLSNTWRGSTDVHFMYGRWADEVLIGDWDGDGKDTIAVRKGNEFHVSNSQRGGNPDSVFTYGRPGDVILVGDWDGDGKDTFAVRRGAEYHVKNTLRGGPADVSFTYGRADDQVLVGDWNGSDVDTLAIRRGATYHVKNSVIGGDADVVFTYGRAADVTLAGDWDGDGTDSFAIQRGRTYHVSNTLSGGDADTVLTFGRLGDEVYVGDWNGDGTDTLGIRRPVGGAATAKAIGTLSKIG